MEETTHPRSAHRSTATARGWCVLTPHTPDAGLRARLPSLDSAVTLEVGPPFRLDEGIALQAEVRALVARHPTAIILDTDGLLPLDEMGVLMLPALAREAAAEGTAVLLANPSRPLHDRLVQLGVRDLTLVARRAPAPAGDEGEQPEGRDEALPSCPCPFCGALRPDGVPAPGRARDPASVVAARQLVDDARRARSQPPRRPVRRDPPGPAAAVAAGWTQDLEPSAELLLLAGTTGGQGRRHPLRGGQVRGGQVRGGQVRGGHGSRPGPAGRCASGDAADGHAADRDGRDEGQRP